MKFSQLPVGLRFLYEGKTYTKTGPLQALADGGNNPRMIMRAARIQTLDDTGSTEREPVTSDRDALEAALALYHRQCLSILETARGAQLASESRQQLDALYAGIRQIASPRPAPEKNTHDLDETPTGSK